MRHTYRAIAVTALVLHLSTVQADVTRHNVAPGIEFEQETILPPAGPLVINVLRVDLKNPAVRIRSELAGDTVIEDNASKGREAIGTLAARHGAAAAINADFFPFTGDPLGVAVRDGELLSEGLPHRVAMGLTADGKLTFDTLVCLGSLYAADGTAWTIDGINRPLNPEELILLTPAYGQKTRVSANALVVPLTGVRSVRVGQDIAADVGELGNGDSVSVIPQDSAVLVASGKSAEWILQHIKSSEKIRIRFDMYANPLPPGPPRSVLASRAAFRGRNGGSAWTDISQAVGGGPWLVRDGKVAVDGVEQGFKDAGFVSGRHPRTAVGGTLTGHLLMVTVDGRQNHSRGMALSELADYMLKLGAYQAINLDGGGSTSMVVRNLYVNGNSDGSPRPVANALLVFSTTPESPAANAIPDSILPLSFTAGDSAKLTLPSRGNAVDETRLIWGTLDGRGFIDQSGRFSPRQAGAGIGGAWVNGALSRVPFTVLPGAPDRITATLTAAPNNPPDRQIAVILIKDRFGNPIAGRGVTVKVMGGVPDYPEVKTDVSGRAEVEIIWDSEVGGQVTVQSGPLPPVVLKSRQ